MSHHRSGRGWSRRLSVVVAAVCTCAAWTAAMAAPADPISAAVVSDEPTRLDDLEPPSAAFDDLIPADVPCPDVPCGPCDPCCPSWRQYAFVEILALQRNNQAGDQPLVLNNDTVVMSVQDLQPATATGMRVFYGERCTDTLGWEVGYLGVYGMWGTATVTGPDTLELPTPLGLAVNNFNGASQVTATYWSTLNLAEVNLFCSDCCAECGPHGRRSCHCLDLIGGFLWAGLDERAGLNVICCDPPEPASYNVRTTTNYYGAQIGMRGRRDWQRWAVEGWWKTAVCGTSLNQSADPIIGSISGQERPAVAASASGMGFIGSLNGTLIYRLTETWGLRAGYNLIWLTNAAMAPTQFDFGTAAGAGTGLNPNGGLFLHGASLGAEARW